MDSERTLAADLPDDRHIYIKTEVFDCLNHHGARLAGRLDLPNSSARGFAVLAHCFTCTKHSIAAVRIAQSLARNGIGVLRFDFTGLGEDEAQGERADTFTGNISDVVAAVEAMAARGRTPSLLIGHSLGGAAVLAAAQRLTDIKAVATIGAPFDVDHVTNLFGDHVPTIVENGRAEVVLGGRRVLISHEFLLDLARHDQTERIAQLRRPLLVLHAPRDDTVGIDNAAAIFGAARHPKSFVALDSADHLLTNADDAAYVADLIACWSDRYITKDI